MKFAAVLALIGAAAFTNAVAIPQDLNSVGSALGSALGSAVGSGNGNGNGNAAGNGNGNGSGSGNEATFGNGNGSGNDGNSLGSLVLSPTVDPNISIL